MSYRLLDLFCKAGGCSVGYSQAGEDAIRKFQNTSSNSDYAKCGTCAECKHFKDCEIEDKACCPDFA